jgi:hypothetical protein
LAAHPIESQFREKEFDKKIRRRRKLESMIDYKYPTIALGATLKRSSMKNEEENFKSIIGGKHQKINSTFTPIGRADSRTRRFWPFHLPNKIYEVEVI